MGWDRRVLPRDRDKDETFPWMGIVTLVLVIGGFLLVVWFVFGIWLDGVAE